MAVPLIGATVLLAAACARVPRVHFCNDADIRHFVARGNYPPDHYSFRFVGFLFILIGCCSWSPPLAWAGHTFTPPGLPPGWGASSTKSETENDTSSPAHKLG